jgi:hypothetical protein
MSTEIIRLKNRKRNEAIMKSMRFEKNADAAERASFSVGRELHLWRALHCFRVSDFRVTLLWTSAFARGVVVKDRRMCRCLTLLLHLTPIRTDRDSVPVRLTERDSVTVR